MTLNPNEAAEALLSMQKARRRANEIKRLPWTYHPAVGAVLGCWVAMQALPRWWFGIALLALVAATYALYDWQREASGRWINGFRMGRTIWVALAMMLVVLALVMTSNPVLMPSIVLFTPIEGGLIAFAAATFLDWMWVRVYDAEMRAGQ
jgi:small-conductance mechanosensitive channel